MWWHLNVTYHQLNISKMVVPGRPIANFDGLHLSLHFHLTRLTVCDDPFFWGRGVGGLASLFCPDSHSHTTLFNGFKIVKFHLIYPAPFYLCITILARPIACDNILFWCFAYDLVSLHAWKPGHNTFRRGRFWIDRDRKFEVVDVIANWRWK